MLTDLVAWSLRIHWVVLSLSLVGIYRYVSRTALFARAVGDTNDLLSRMRRRVATDLEEQLGPVFERSEGEPRTVLPDEYSERPTSPVGSEKFREALRRVLSSNIAVVVDYGRVSRAEARWHSYARTLSWTVLVLAIWEVASLATLGGVERFREVVVPGWLATWSLTPTAALVVVFFVCQCVMLRQCDVIHNSERRYHDL